MTQTEWEGLKRLHEIEDDAQLHSFLLNYVPTEHISLTPNEVMFLRRVLSGYEPDYHESGIKDKILRRLCI